MVTDLVALNRGEKSFGGSFCKEKEVAVQQETMKILWFLAVVFTCTVVQSDGLGLCLPEHPQTSFCNADYVMRVRVVSMVKKEQWSSKPGKVPPPPVTPEPPRKTHSEVVTDRSNEVESKVEVSTTSMSPYTPAIPSGRAPPSLPPRVPRRKKVRQARGLFSSFGSGGSNKFWNYFSHSVRYQRVLVKRVMKGKKLLKNLKGVQKNANNLVTYARVYVSGIKLKPGRAYLLMGKVIENRLWLSRCNMHQEWDSLTLFQRAALKKYYQMNCDCHVESCFHLDCQKEKVPGGCMWRPRTFPPSTDCGVKHRYCKKKNGKCVWMKEMNYNRCVMNLWPF